MATPITVVGSIGATPERRTTSRDDPFARFRIASTERRTDDSGMWVDGNTSWYEVQAYGALGENALASLTKGQRVVVHGDLTVREWQASDGSRRTTTQIRATAIGHDLLFGRSVFSRVPRHTAPATQQASPHAEQAQAQVQAAPSRDLSDEWAPVLTPGSGVPSAGELVGAGVPDDIPF